MARKKRIDIMTIDPRIARQTLALLADQYKNLRPDIEKCLSEAMDCPDFEDLAAEIAGLLTSLDEDDLYARAGRTYCGYNEPEESVSEILTEKLDPYFKRFNKSLKEQNQSRSLSLCKSIVLALYRLEKNDYCDNNIEEYVHDFAYETAGWVVQLWRANGDEKKACKNKYDKSKKFPREFVEKHTPEWDWLVRN